MKTLLALLLIPCSFAFATPPGILHHQGRIVVSTTNHDGPGFFKFALVNADGTATYWTHDGTASGEPAGAVQLAVSKGLYSVGLGDTAVAGISQAIPADVFSANADVRLRIWFSSAAAGPFEQLASDQRVTSAGFALSATTAASVSGNVSAAQISGGTAERHAVRRCLHLRRQARPRRGGREFE